MGARMTFRVQFEDSQDLAWFWACGDADTHYRGEVIDLRERWEERIGSAMRYLEVFQPLMLLNHDRESLPVGIIRRGRVLTRDEAVALGIDQEHDRALYLGADLNDVGLGHDQRGELVYSSLGFDLDWPDEHGQAWPMAIKEFSCVTVPHLKAGQIQRPALRSVQLSEQGKTMTDEETAPEAGAEMEGGPTVADLLEMLNALAAEVAAMKDAAATGADAEMGDGPDDEDEEPKGAASAEYAELRSQLNTVQVALQERDADDAVRVLRESKAMSDEQAGTARKLFMTSPEAFALLSESLPDRLSETERKAGSGAPKGIGVVARANQIKSAQGVTFKEGLTQAYAEGYTNEVQA